MKVLVAELTLENRLLKKKHDRVWGRRGMRYCAHHIERWASGGASAFRPVGLARQIIQYVCGQ